MKTARRDLLGECRVIDVPTTTKAPMMNTNPYFLETERLGFRKWGENDLDLAIGLWSDIEVTKRIDARGKLSREQITDRFIQEIAVEQKWGVQYRPVFLLQNDQQIGVCGPPTTVR